MSGLQNVLLVAYLLIVVAMIAVILLQRSEGGGLGMGGNAGGLMTVRGSANLLTRTTAILAALFFATAIGLTILSQLDRGTDTILDQAVSAPSGEPSTVLDALSQLQTQTSSAVVETPSTASSASTDPGLALPTTPAAPSETATSSSAAPASSSASAPAPSSSAPAQ